MNNSIRILIILLSIQLIFSLNVNSQTLSESGQSEIFKKGLSFGLFNSRLEKSFQLGINTEYIKSSIFGIELDVSGEYSNRNWQIFGRGISKDFNLDVSLNAKYYFNDKNDWYIKLGYYFNSHLFNLSELNFWEIEGERQNSGLQFALAKNWNLNKGISIKVEPIIRYKFKSFVSEDFRGGIKIGFMY